MSDPITLSALASGTVIQTINDVVNNRLIRNTRDTSLVDITAPARVEPLCVIGADCVHLEYMPDIMQTLQSIFTGYYLQAVALTANVEGVKVMKTLDRLNPNRNMPALIATESWRLASEAYKYRLPTSTNKVAMEAEQESVKTNLDKDTFSTVSDVSNLCVGKMVKVSIKNEEDKAFDLMVSVRLMVNQLPEHVITQILAMEGDGNAIGFSERYHAWRAGRISFIKDLVLCQDLISEHRKALMKDKEGVYSEIISRVNKLKTAGFLENNPSLNVASNLYVISENTAAKIEEKLGGKLSNPRIRQKMFSSSYAMIIVVVDRQWERVTFYTRGIAVGTQLGLRDLKNANKGSGPSIEDIMKAFVLGNNPSL